jgi:SAM-dependent methyltransferase
MTSAALVELVQCPDCAGSLSRDQSAVTCTSCARRFDASAGFLDLRPIQTFTEQTRYLDESLHRDARHEAVAPPVLGSKIRNDMLRAFLAPGPGDRVVDLGCGSGRTLVWNLGSGAALTGVDVSAFFAAEALERCDIVRGDLRRLPFKSGSFAKAWSLDVLEHLSPDALRDVLAEANRALADRGALFIYTHVRKNGWIAGGVRAVNAIARLCERIGLIDLRQERLRKSDHVNPIADHEELERVLAACGFRLERITYYTPVIGALIENVFVRIGERWLARRTSRRSGSPPDDEAVRRVRSAAQARVRRGGFAYRALVVLSALMKLDVLLFGRLRSGPFFALVRKTGPGPTAQGPSTNAGQPWAVGPGAQA